MAVCLEYQSVATVARSEGISLRVQVGVVALLAVALAVRVWVKHECTDLGYSLADEKGQTVTLDMKRRELELQHSVLMKRETLDGAARQRLKLISPNPQQIIAIKN